MLFVVCGVPRRVANNSACVKRIFLYRLKRESRQGDSAHGAGCLRVILPVCRFTLPAHDRSGDPHRRYRRVQVEVAKADCEDFTEARGGAVHDLHDLPELPVWSRACLDRSMLPCAGVRPDRFELVPGEDVGCADWAAEPRDVIHRIAWENLVAHREREGEAEDDAGLSCPVVALFRELFEEVVAAGVADFAEGDFCEERKYKGAHVAFVKQSGRPGESVFDLHVFEPVRHQCREGAVGAHTGESGLEEVAFGKLLLQRSFGSGSGGAGGLDVSALPVPVAIARAGDVASARCARGGDAAEGADRGAGSSQGRSPLRGRWTGTVLPGHRCGVVNASINSGTVARPWPGEWVTCNGSRAGESYRLGHATVTHVSCGLRARRFEERSAPSLRGSAYTVSDRGTPASLNSIEITLSCPAQSSSTATASSLSS